MGIHMKLGFLNSTAYEMICLNDALWLCIINKNISWPPDANFDPCLRTYEQISIIYIHAFIIMPLAVHISF